MRRFFLAALSVFAVAGIASAQQPLPQYQPQPAQYQPQYQQPAYALPPAAAAATPIAPVSGVNVIKGSGGCSNCPTTTANVRGAFKMAGGGDCKYGSTTCQNGCGSVKSDLAFHFGSCKDFFSPCGPRCPTLPFATPFGTGFGCPRGYDSYSNH